MNTDKDTKQVDIDDVNVSAAEEDGGGVNDTADHADANMSDGEAEVQQQPDKMADDAAQWRDKYMRLSAEFDNFRKRTLKEKMELISSASEDVIKVLLPVVDDFERAICAAEKTSDLDAIRQGVVLISNKLHDTLKVKGLKEIEALGKELDTDFHEAIAKIPAEKKQKGKIVDVVQKGYKINDKVIRHCKVVVGE